MLGALALALGVTGCAGPAGSGRHHRYTRAKLQDTLARMEKPGLVLGEFPLDPGRAVIDGDTIRVKGLKTTLRLLAIDTEETFKHKKERRLFQTGWAHYKQVIQGHKLRPAKYATPLGMDAKRWAERFFTGVTTVRLERDDPQEIRGFYDRYLVYVFAKKDGRWVNYNLAAVRAGMTPYFTKYGYSRRFDAAFRRAQAAARAEHRGIWDPSRRHYPDYPARLAWWNARGDFIRDFEAKMKTHPSYVELTHWDAFKRLGQLVGRKVTILGTVAKIKLGDRGPTLVFLARRMHELFPLVFFDKDVYGVSNIGQYQREFVEVTGEVTRYHNHYTGRTNLEIVVDLPSQVVGAPVPGLPRMAPPPEVSARSKVIP